MDEYSEDEYNETVEAVKQLCIEYNYPIEESYIEEQPFSTDYTIVLENKMEIILSIYIYGKSCSNDILFDVIDIWDKDGNLIFTHRVHKADFRKKEIIELLKCNILLLSGSSDFV